LWSNSLWNLKDAPLKKGAMQRIVDYIVSLDRPRRHLAFRMFRSFISVRFSEAEKLAVIRSLVAAYFCVDADSVVIAEAAIQHMAPELTSVEVIEHLGPHRLRLIADTQSSPVRKWFLEEAGLLV